VIDLVILEDTEAYRSLEENLKRIGFERAENEKGQKQSWRWKIRMEDGTSIVLELLADNPALRGGKVEPLPTEGQISALNIPHCSIVFDLHDTVEVTAKLISEKGVATETIRFANVVSFTMLKALAFDDRAEGKDAHDLVYCIENVPGGMYSVVTALRSTAGREVRRGHCGRHGNPPQSLPERRKDRGISKGWSGCRGAFRARRRARCSGSQDSATKGSRGDHGKAG
jgi:hypothetical protein